MKHLIVYISCFVILLSATLTQARPSKLPTRSQLVKLIKKSRLVDVGATGIRSYDGCDKASIKSVKILKVGRASSNYYERSGDYINSSFVVKFKATGSCYFEDFHKFYKDIDGDGRNYDEIAGTLPIIDEPLRVVIRTDEYGDWKADVVNLEGDNFDKPRIKNHIKQIFIKAKAATGNRYATKVFVTNQASAKISGTNYQGFAATDKKFKREDPMYAEIQVVKAFGTKYRPAVWGDLVNYAEDNGDVTEVFKHLGIPPEEGAFLESNHYYAAHCSRFVSGKYLSPKRKLATQPICYAEAFDRESHKLLAVKKSIFGDDENRPKYKKQHTKTTNKNRFANKGINQQLASEIFSYFENRPKLVRAFNAKSKDRQEYYLRQITKGKTKRERYRRFLSLVPKIQGGNHSSSRSKYGSKSIRHSHGGRFHAHKLPPQGKAHRHRNGPLGR